MTRNAWAYAIGAAVLLLALAAPVLALRVGIPDDGALPETRTERRAYDLVAEGFGPGINGPLVVAVDVSEDPTVVQPLLEAIEADEGIAAVAPPEVHAEAGVATLVAFPTTGPQDDATLDTIERLRADVLPAALDGSPARAHVGGQTASFADVGDRVHDRLPLLIAAVVLLSFLLLTLVFRSVVVPLKAALLNLLSIGASYGVMVMVFQWGWGAGSSAWNRPCRSSRSSPCSCSRSSSASRWTTRCSCSPGCVRSTPPPATTTPRSSAASPAPPG